jgi:hypothetical protein
MMIAGVQVIIAICNYTFDVTPMIPQEKSIEGTARPQAGARESSAQHDEEEPLVKKESSSSS